MLEWTGDDQARSARSDYISSCTFIASSLRRVSSIPRLSPRHGEYHRDRPFQPRVRSLFLSLSPSDLSSSHQAPLGPRKGIPYIRTSTPRPNPDNMANRPLHPTPIHPILVHVLSRPKTRHPSHPPPAPPDTHHRSTALIVRLRMERPET